MPYCDGLEMEPDRDLYFTKDDNKAKSSELGVKYSEKLSEYTRNTRKALGALKSTISPNNANRFKDKFLAIALWKAIQNTFGESGLDTIGRFYTTLSNANYNNCTSMDEYTSQIQSSAHYLQSLKSPIPDIILAYILLAGLSESFDAFAFRKYKKIGKNLSDIGISKLVSDLIAEENRVQSANSQANRVRKKPAISACSHCQKPGHIKDKCFKKYLELFAEYKAKRDAKKDAKEPNSRLTKSLIIAQAVKTPKSLNLSLKLAQSLNLSPKLIIDKSKINLEYFN